MAKTDLKNKSFADLMSKLDEISHWLEQDNTDLEQAVEKFEEGMEITQELQKRLKSAEQKIEKITVQSTQTES